MNVFLNDEILPHGAPGGGGDTSNTTVWKIRTLVAVRGVDGSHIVSHGNEYGASESRYAGGAVFPGGKRCTRGDRSLDTGLRLTVFEDAYGDARGKRHRDLEEVQASRFEISLAQWERNFLVNVLLTGEAAIHESDVIQPFRDRG
jgi:hypothetical protein